MALPNYIPIPAFAIPILAEATHGRDYVVRVQTTNSQISVTSVATASLANAFRTALHSNSLLLQGSCQTLGKVIDRLKDREEYNNHYREYLLGNLSDEEFERVAEKYAYTPKVANLLELSEQINTLLAYTTHEFTKDEVAELFQARDIDVEKIISAQLPLFAALESSESA